MKDNLERKIKQSFDNLSVPKVSENLKNQHIERAGDFFEKNFKKTQGISSERRLTNKFNLLFIKFKEKFTMEKSVKFFGTLAVAMIALVIGTTLQKQQNLLTIPSTETKRVEDLTESTKQEGAPLVTQREPLALPKKETDSALRNVAPAPHKQPATSQPRDDTHTTGASVVEEMEALAPATRMELSKGVSKQMLSKQKSMVQSFASDMVGGFAPPLEYRGRDQFEKFDSNTVKQVVSEPVSTFSADVDTASYAFVRRQLNNGLLPQKNAVRVEELINYFDYDYPLATSPEQPFKPTVAVYPTPWNKTTKLLHIGIKGYDIVPDKKPASNLVFLIDVSGSMSSTDKLPLAKNAIRMLVDSMDKNDTVSIVVYAGAAGMVLEPTTGDHKEKIKSALDKLNAGGSTAGGAGIRLAYSLAQQHFNKESVNRVLLFTDGDFNTGISNTEELKSFIERKRKTGIYFSVFGFGQGNLNDRLMQALAQNGNGNAAYIDTLNEARKVLVEEASSTLFPIASDVKFQVEFNPAKVSEYRLIGYETRALKQADFNNDQVDAGDIGAGHTVTAIYEITPVGAQDKYIDPLRYQADKPVLAAPQNQNSEYAFLKIRYKLPGETTSKLITLPVDNGMEIENITNTSDDIKFAAAVAAFGQIIKNDAYTKDFNYDDVINLAIPAKGMDPFGYRAEFVNMVRLAKSAGAMR